MSGRGASAAVLTELGKAANEPAHLVEVRLDAADGGTVYLTDSYRAIAWNGNTYAAGGHLLSFSGLTETSLLGVANAKVSLSGVDQTWIAILLSKQYIDRRLLIYKAMFNTATEALIVDPFPIHDGRMDEPVVAEDPLQGSCTISISSRDQFADFERLAGRHTNPVEQNIFFPNDRAFDLVAQIAGQQVQLLWGAPSPGQAAATVGVAAGWGGPDNAG